MFRPHALRILADVDEAGTALDGFAGVPRGTLRVSVPFTLAVALVSPMLPSFLATYPEVRVVLDVENRIIDMPVEAADLVIRVGVLPDSDLIARHLMTTEVWTCASPGYIEKHGSPVNVGDLGGHTLISGFDRLTTWSYQFPDGRTEVMEFRPADVISDSAVLEPVLNGGAGIGRLPDFLGRKSVASGHLVRLLSDTRGDTFDIHAIYASHRSLSAKVRVFIDALVSELGREDVDPRSY